MNPSTQNGPKRARQVCSFGSWKSPISAADLAAAAISYSLPRADGGDVLWCERRPHEASRVAIVRRQSDGDVVDVIDPPFSARSKVHEYGGGQFAASAGRVCFINDEDQDLYLASDGAPVRITDVPDTRFADLAFDPARPRLYAVTERHRPTAQPQNAIAAIGLEGDGQGRIDLLVAGRDFYASPRPSPNGGLIAWLAWDLPAMPWETAELWVGQLTDNGAIIEAEKVAGGTGGGAFQPEWAADGALYFAAPHGDWGNLYVWRDGKVRLVAELEAEFSRPLWSLGMSSYAVLEPGRLIAACWRNGRAELGIAEEISGTWRPLTSGFARIDDLVAGPELIAINGSDDEAPGRVHLIARDAPEFWPAKQKDAPFLGAGDISHAQILGFKTGEYEARALYYPPANDRFCAPDGTQPPLIVSAHGGPTGMARRGFALDRQYWTTRGFAFLDVDYRGSSGYGLAFQKALDGLWGEADSQDAIAAVEHVIGEGLCDPTRIVIRGSSAGGLTVLNALICSERFAAGASYYGVTDLTRLAADTHKFESGYLDSLIGGMPTDIPDVYAARSPVHHAERITAPVIFFQGLDDRVVPPEQSRAMVSSLKARGIPVAAYEFAGEGHGFRKSDTVITALEAELSFYARILGLEADEELAMVEIANFGDRR